VGNGKLSCPFRGLVLDGFRGSGISMKPFSSYDKYVLSYYQASNDGGDWICNKYFKLNDACYLIENLALCKEFACYLDYESESRYIIVVTCNLVYRFLWSFLHEAILQH
jgi:hypothetical protein